MLIIYRSRLSLLARILVKTFLLNILLLKMAWQPGPRVDCETTPDLSHVANKTAVVTGGKFFPPYTFRCFNPLTTICLGTGGIGKAFVLALHNAE